MAVLLAVMMIVPMVLSAVNAADPSGTKSFTAAKRFADDAGAGYTQLPGENYPMKPYHLTFRTTLTDLDIGSEEKHTGYIWTQGNGIAYGFDITEDTVFVAQSGWTISDTTTFFVTEDCYLDVNETYQFDWYVSSTRIMAYVDGEKVLDFVADGLWETGTYLIHYPAGIWADVYEASVISQDGADVYAEGTAMAGWTAFSEGWSDATVDVTVKTYDVDISDLQAAVVDEMIDAIGPVGYNEWLPYTTDGGARFAFGSEWGAYDKVGVDLSSPVVFDIDFQLVSNDEDPKGEYQSYLGGALDSSAYMGYNADTQKFEIRNPIGNDPRTIKNPDWSVIAISDSTYDLDPNKLYNMKLIYGADYAAIEFQGIEILRATGQYCCFPSGSANMYFHSPCVTVQFAKFEIVDIASGAVLLAGQDFAKHATNSGYTTVTINAEKYINNGAAIYKAWTAYNELSPAAQALVTKYDILEDAYTTYNAKVSAAAQGEADNIIALIDAIGTVTLDSIDAIAAAENAYASVSPEAQALVTNYDVLTAARAKYDKYVVDIANTNALIAAIGTVHREEPTNRTTDYDNTGFLGSFTGDNGYSNQVDYKGETGLTDDYVMEFDFQVLSGRTDRDNAILGGGAGNFVIGYDFPTGKFAINPGNPWSDLATTDADYAMDLLPELVYHWKMEVCSDHVALYIDDTQVIYTTDIVREDGTYFIFYSKYCDVKFANYSFICGDTVVADHLNGQALIDDTSWGGRSGAYGTTVVPIHADAVIDSLDKIVAAEAAYADLDDYAKTQVDSATLFQAREVYDLLGLSAEVAAAVAAINAIGEVTLESGALIVAAEAAYDAVAADEKDLVSNYDVLVAARTTYDALVAAKERADRIANVEALIDAIGTVGYVDDATVVDQGILVDVLAYADQGYCHVEGLNAGNPFTIEYDFVTVANGDQDASWTGFGLSNGIGAGYSYKEQKFFITAESRIFGSTAARLLTCASDVFPLAGNTIYHIKFDFGTSESAIYVDGVKVVSSTEQLCAGSSWCIFYPAYCSYKMTNLTITSDGAALCEGLKGQDLVDNTVWPFSASFNSVGLVPMLVDSNAAITAAETAFAALPADEQADVANAAALVAARELYDSLIPGPAFTYGDTNDDGAIDIKDIVLIRQYVANYDDDLGTSTVALVEAAADVNADGAIDIKDIVLLRQYVANYDDDLGTSTVVLGPQP